MLELSKAYNKALEDEKTMTSEQKTLKNVGKQVSHFSLPLLLFLLRALTPFPPHSDCFNAFTSPSLY